MWHWDITYWRDEITVVFRASPETAKSQSLVNFPSEKSEIPPLRELPKEILQVTPEPQSAVCSSSPAEEPFLSAVIPHFSLPMWCGIGVGGILLISALLILIINGMKKKREKTEKLIYSQFCKYGHRLEQLLVHDASRLSEQAQLELQQLVKSLAGVLCAESPQEDLPTESTEKEEVETATTEVEQESSAPLSSENVPSPQIGGGNQPLPDMLQHPVPNICLLPEHGQDEEAADIFSVPAPGADDLQQMIENAETAAFLRMVREPRQQLAVAKAFCEWAADKPDGSSLLLEARPDVCYWFVGDLHGDIESLIRIYAFLRHCMQNDERHVQHHLICLGDYVDRGDEDIAVLTMLQYLTMHSHSQSNLVVTCLQGNHDSGIYRKAGGAFASRVKPAEFVETLGKMPPEEADIIGSAAIEFARTAPVMGELTGLRADFPEATILFTHGGVPHTDLQRSFYRDARPIPSAAGRPLLDALPQEYRAAWSEDFTWVRMVEKAPVKIPNRASHGCDLGTEDLNSYRRLHLELTGRAITFVLRGHDHEPGGFSLYSYDAAMNPSTSRFVQRNCGVLTINAMQRSMAVDSETVVARWCYGESLLLYRLPFSR